ncbi:MAG: hypothetical protein ACJ71H_12455 [Nitrososphaeraceae archaeon]
MPLTTDDNSSLPNNNTSDLNYNSSSTGLEPKEEGEGIKFTPDYEEKEPVFWCIFEELSNDGNGLVDYYKLQERLLSTGILYAGDAVLMIEQLIFPSNYHTDSTDTKHEEFFRLPLKYSLLMEFPDYTYNKPIWI